MHKTNKIIRQVRLSPDLIKLLDAPKDDPNVTIAFGLFSNFVEKIIRENLLEYFEAIYGTDGKNALKFLMQKLDPLPEEDKQQDLFP